MKKTVRGLLTVVALSAGCFAGATQAAIMTVDDNVTDLQYLSAGDTIAGTFDLRPFLTSNSVIDWARVTFHFEDDYDPLRYTGGGSYYSGYQRTYTNDRESVSVSTLGQSSTAMTTPEIEQSFSPRTVARIAFRTVSYRYSYRCGWFRRCTGTRYLRVPYTTVSTVQDVTTRTIAEGPFSASYLLDSDALNRLLDVGLADFQVSGEAGDAMFRNATLEASISSVSEPSVLVLLALGLGGLVFRQRRSAQTA